MLTPISYVAEQNIDASLEAKIRGNTVRFEKDSNGDWTICKTKNWPIIVLIFMACLSAFPYVLMIWYPMLYLGMKKLKIRQSKTSQLEHNLFKNVSKGPAFFVTNANSND